MSFKMKYGITPRYLTAPSKRRSGIKMNDVVFIVAHDTGNANSTAAQNVRYYENSRNDISASAHLFVDDKEILECIPALTGSPEKAWHVRNNVPGDNKRYGADANDAAIGVELCFSKNGSINNEEAYKRYVWVLAYICYRFGLDPSTSIIGHEHLDPSRRNDPSTALRLTGRTFENLVDDVVQEYAASKGGGNAVLAERASAEPVGDKVGVATILVNALNVRSQPSLSGSVVQVVNKGESYKVYTEQNGWYGVGENQWISANPSYVQFTPTASRQQSATPSAPKSASDGIGIAVILTDSLNVRSQPSINGSVVNVVNKGESYKVYTEQNGWYGVGENQWISTNPKYVSFRPK